MKLLAKLFEKYTFIETVYDDYGNNSRIHYLEEGHAISCLADGVGPDYN